MFTTKKKLLFAIFYIYYILRIPLDTYRGKFPLLAAQTVWALERLLKVKISLPEKMYTNYANTIFGKFWITPDLISNFAVSPSFERTEIKRLFALIDKEKKMNRKILFIDIGAFFGLYTVAVGNRYKKYKKLDIMTFEPGTEYLSQPTLELLEKNIKGNNLKNVVLHKVGIGSSNGLTKNKMKIQMLSSVLRNDAYRRYDAVFIKLDIDDYVIDGLKGIQESIERFNKAILLVEDFVKYKQVMFYLKKNHYKFLYKETPYNSFWRLVNEKNT